MSFFRRMMMLKKQSEPPTPIVTVYEGSGIFFSAGETTTIGRTAGYLLVKRECKPNTIYTVLLSTKPSSISRICYSDEDYDGITVINAYGFKNNGRSQEYSFRTNSSARYIYVSVSMSDMTSDAVSIIENTVVIASNPVTITTNINSSVYGIRRTVELEPDERYIIYFDVHYKCISEQTEGAGVKFRTRSTSTFNYNPKAELTIALNAEGDILNNLNTQTITSNIDSYMIVASSNHDSSHKGVVEITISNYTLAYCTK